MKKIILLGALLYPILSSAQDANFCAQIDSVVSRLFSAPLSMHGQDRSRENEFTVSTPDITLEGATKCEFSTSSRDDGLSYAYQCDWNQNRGTTPDAAFQQGAALANGISGCTKAKLTVINGNERTKWRGRVRSGQHSMTAEVRDTLNNS